MSNDSRKHPESFFKNITLSNIKILEIETEKLWKRPAPNNPGGPSNILLKILNMGSRSIRKHEMEIWLSEIKIYQKNMTWQFGNMGSISFENTR